MPSRNSVKQYVAGGYYHVYNRGVEKRNIFLDSQDCSVFLRYMKLYLSSLEDIFMLQQTDLRAHRFLSKNLSKDIDLLAFSLMPNHFHLLLKQNTHDGMIKFLRRLTTSYVMYFNKKYKRVGGLFQSKYKAALIEYDEYILHLSRYIHLNPKGLKNLISFEEFSSYPFYLGRKYANWLNTKEILSYFRSSDLSMSFSYEQFVEDYNVDPKNLLGDLALED